MDRLLSSFNVYGTLIIAMFIARETCSERSSVLGKSPVTRRMQPVVETWSSFL